MPWIKVLVSLVVAIAVYRYHAIVPSDRFSDIYTLAASLSATLLGFVFTALSILIAVPSAPLIAKLKASGHYEQLTYEMLLTAAVLFIGMVIGMTATLAPTICQGYVLCLVAGIFALSMQCFAFVGYKFYLVMEYLGKQH